MNKQMKLGSKLWVTPMSKDEIIKFKKENKMQDEKQEITVKDALKLLSRYEALYKTSDFKIIRIENKGRMEALLDIFEMLLHNGEIDEYYYKKFITEYEKTMRRLP